MTFSRSKSINNTNNKHSINNTNIRNSSNNVIIMLDSKERNSPIARIKLNTMGTHRHTITKAITGDQAHEEVSMVSRTVEHTATRATKDKDPTIRGTHMAIMYKEMTMTMKRCGEGTIHNVLEFCAFYAVILSHRWREPTHGISSLLISGIAAGSFYGTVRIPLSHVEASIYRFLKHFPVLYSTYAQYCTEA